MTNTVGTLKISKKMAVMLIEAFPEGGLRQRIEAEQQAERFQKDGAVMIEADSDDVALLYGYATGSMSKLDAALLTAAPEDKHKLLGQHSAWRALVRQVAPMFPADARHAPPPEA